MFDASETRLLSHGFTSFNVSVNCPVEPGDFDRCLFVAGMPERAHFVPLRGISRISFRHDDLFDFESLKCIIVVFRFQHLVTFRLFLSPHTVLLDAEK
jgi:hypothetical protein